MTQLTEEMAQALIDANIKLVGSVPAAEGYHSVGLSAKEAAAFFVDPEGFAAAFYGVSRDDYRSWLAAEFCARCGGTTKKGTRCRKMVPGGTLVPPKLWLRLEGSYCELHGG